LDNWIRKSIVWDQLLDSSHLVFLSLLVSLFEQELSTPTITLMATHQQQQHQEYGERSLVHH
jgi:hypothetical protein